MADLTRYSPCKIFLTLALFECIIILICQFSGKDNFLSLSLQRINLVSYLPGSSDPPYPLHQHDPPISTRSLSRSLYEEDVYRHRTRLNYTSIILSNPMFAGFNISVPVRRKRVTVLIIVSTAPRRGDRRQAIRETWWVECKQLKKVRPECIFMTDYQSPGDMYYDTLQEEHAKYGDLRFQYVEGGVTFGMRMLNHMLYALTNYDFDYFLRMDDDIFFCLENFLREVPLPMIKGYHWGWVHCIPPITRPEESIIMFSHDIIRDFLSQDPDTILCHPFSDQMIAAWSNSLDMTYLFRHDKRIYHTPIVSKRPVLRTIPEVCRTFISIHGTYPDDMRLFWRHRGPGKSNKRPMKDLFRNSEVCPIRAPFDWKVFTSIWRYEPKLCKTNPTWDFSQQNVVDGSYTGREAELVNATNSGV